MTAVMKFCELIPERTMMSLRGKQPTMFYMTWQRRLTTYLTLRTEAEYNNMVTKGMLHVLVGQAVSSARNIQRN